MSDKLPAGFTLDDLPAGFTLDEPTPKVRTDPRLPYQQTPEGQAVARRYGVLPEQLEETKQWALEDILATPRVTAKTLVRGVPAAGGAMIGAGLGPVGAVVGGGLGYSMGGRLEELLGLEERPATISEGIGKSIEDIPYGMGYEMGGQMAGRGLEKLFAPRGARVTPQGEQLRQTLQKAGVTPDPGDVAPGGILPRVEAMAEKQVGGGRITEAGRREVEGMRGSPATGEEGWLAREARRVSGPEHQLDASRVARGETIQAGLKDLATTNRQLAGIEWDTLKTYDTGTPDFPIENLRGAMRQKMATAGTLQQAITPQTSSRLTSSGGSSAGWTPEKVRVKGTKGPTFSPDAPGPSPRPRRANEPFLTEQMVRGTSESQIVSGLANGEGPVTFEQARSLRSALGELYEQNPKQWGGPLSALRQDLDAYASAHPERGAAYTQARKIYRENVVPFDRGETLGQLIDRNEPVAVVRELMQPRDARVNLLRAIKQQTGGRGPTWQATNSEAISQSLERPQVLRDMGPETKALLFTPEQREFLDELQNWTQASSAFLKSEKGLYARTGTNIVGYDQLRHGVTLLLGGAVGSAGAYGASLPAMLAGGTILVSPSIVARMVTTPGTARWLAQGFQTPARTPEALRIAAQLLPAYHKAVADEARELRERGLTAMLKGRAGTTLANPGGRTK